MALSASVGAAVCCATGVEIAHWLLLQKRTTGAFMTPAKVNPSWNAPSEVAPSPKSVSATQSSPLSADPHAKPTACGIWVAIGTQMEATLNSAGFHQPAGCPLHHERTVETGIPRRSPMADSR